jgi:hypothetical protein
MYLRMFSTQQEVIICIYINIIRLQLQYTGGRFLLSIYLSKPLYYGIVIFKKRRHLAKHFL